MRNFNSLSKLMKVALLICLLSNLDISHGWGITLSSRSNLNPIKSNKNVKIVDILISKIEGTIIYSSTGNRYEIKPYTKVIDNRKKDRHHKVTIGELIFKNGKLETVILRGGY